MGDAYIGYQKKLNVIEDNNETTHEQGGFQYMVIQLLVMIVRLLISLDMKK